jgi:hypothetical protein
MLRAWVSLPAMLVAFGCGALLGYRIHEHPDDREDQGVPGIVEGGCDDADVVELSSLFGADGLPAADAPVGQRVALEANPEGVLICTQRGCNFECCDNGCGYELGCAYQLGDGLSAVCLDHEDFRCGGSDCSAYCSPLSQAPAHDYRFVGTLELRGGRLTLATEAYCRADE